jgi:hypothetical protein
MINILKLVFYVVNRIFVDYFLLMLFKNHYLTNRTNNRTGFLYQSNINLPLQNEMKEIKVPTSINLESLSLCNYIRYEYFCNSEDKNKQAYLQSKTELTSLYSVEHLLESSNQRDIQSTSLVSSADVLTNLRFFYVKKTKVIKTKVGGCLTVILVIGLALCIYFFSDDFFHQRHPDINSFYYSLYEIKDPNMTAHLDVPIILYYSKSIAKTTRILLDKYGNYSISPKISDCSQQEYDRFYFVPKNESLIYKCTNLKSIIDNPYLQVSTFIYILRCSDINKYVKDPTCTEEIDPQEKFYFGYQIEYKYFNFTNGMLEPQIISHNKTSTYFDSFYAYQEYQIYFLETDENILFDNPISKYFSGIALYDHRINIPSFRFRWKDNIVDVYERKLTKFPKMLVNVMLIFTLIRFVIKIIIAMYSDYFHLRHFAKIYLRRTDIVNLNLSNNQSHIAQDIDRDFTFGKYFFNKCFCARKTNAYHKLEMEVRKFISIENFVGNKGMNSDTLIK